MKNKDQRKRKKKNIMDIKEEEKEISFKFVNI